MTPPGANTAKIYEVALATAKELVAHNGPFVFTAEEPGPGISAKTVERIAAAFTAAMHNFVYAADVDNSPLAETLAIPVTAVEYVGDGLYERFGYRKSEGAARRAVSNLIQRGISVTRSDCARIAVDLSRQLASRTHAKADSLEVPALHDLADCYEQFGADIEHAIVHGDVSSRTLVSPAAEEHLPDESFENVQGAIG